MIDSRNIFSSSSVGLTTRQIINRQSTSPCVPIFIGTSANAQAFGAQVNLCGAVTAGVLKTVLSISGTAGRMPMLLVGSANATSRTIRCRVTVDGQASPYAFDSTTTDNESNNIGIAVAGYYNTTSGGIPDNVITWSNSIVVEVASSLTETDFIFVAYKYTTEQ